MGKVGKTADIYVMGWGRSANYLRGSNGMIAWVNGVMIQGSPEEIEHYLMITAQKVTTTGFFKIQEDDVPEHVKNYGKYNYDYISKGQTHRVWY